MTYGAVIIPQPLIPSFRKPNPICFPIDDLAVMGLMWRQTAVSLLRTGVGVGNCAGKPGVNVL